MIGQPKPLGSLLFLLSGWVCVRATMILQPVNQVRENLAASFNPQRAPEFNQYVSPKIRRQATAAKRISIVLDEPIQFASAVGPQPIKVAGSVPLANQITITLEAPVPEMIAMVQTHESRHEQGLITKSNIKTPTGSGLRISSWVSLRDGRSASSFAGSGQLGTSQIGIRAILPIIEQSSRSRFSVAARASMPLATSREKEAGLGLVYRQDGVAPIEIGIERRFSLSQGGRNAFALYAATGVNDLALGNEWSLSGYAQAGIVGMRSRDGFVDGAVAMERDLFSSQGVKVKAGLGAWGAAQPGVARFDIGPIATLKTGNIRVSASYRMRVAGDASPRSGPAITIGSDF